MNLIFCTSPLQVLIAEAIIREHPNEEFYGIMLYHSHRRSAKFDYYTERLKNACTEFKCIVVNGWQGKLKAYYTSLKMLALGYQIPKVKKVFLASFDQTEIHYILQAHKSAEIQSFDDGLINLSPASWQHFMRIYPSGWDALLDKILGLPSTLSLIKSSTKHYTIYKEENVMPNTTFLKLFDTKDTQEIPCTKEVSILMGQALYWEEEYILNTELAEQVISNYKIEAYIPHPKETYIVSNAKHIETPLIFEDYILQQLRENPDTEYHIYLYCSSSAINLLGTPRLKFIALKPEDAPEMFDDVYDLIERVGIPVIKIASPRTTQA